MSSPSQPIGANRQELLERAKLLGLRALTLVEGLRVGDQASPLRGFSVEFAQHREYVPGDDLRHIDWRGYARTERYIVKQYEQETNYTAQILLDLSGSMSYGNPGQTKYEQARLLAAVMSQVAISQSNAVGLKTLDEPGSRERLVQFPPSTKPDRLRILLDELSRLNPASDRGREQSIPLVTPALRETAERITRRGMIAVFSDFFEPLEPLMAELHQLRVRGHDVMLFHILHSHEIDLPWEGQVLFEDLESSDSLITQPHQLRASYQKAIQEWLEQFKTSCTRLQIEYMLVRSDIPPDDSLLEMLARRLRKRRVGSIS